MPYTNLLVNNTVIKCPQLRGDPTRNRLGAMTNRCKGVIESSKEGGQIDLLYNGNVVTIIQWTICNDTGTIHGITGHNNRWSTASLSVAEFMIHASVKRCCLRAVAMQKGSIWPKQMIDKGIWNEQTKWN